jgi:hypothetical protein
VELLIFVFCRVAWGIHQAESFVKLPAHRNSDGVGFVRDLALNFRHDIGIGWSDDYPKPSGILVLLNQNATTNCDPPPANALLNSSKQHAAPFDSIFFRQFLRPT